MNIYVGNLSRDVNEDELRVAFEAFGEVESTNIIKDKFSGESRGFGFVVMRSQEDAAKAIEGMNNTELKEMNIVVSEAHPRPTARRGGQNRRGGGFGGKRGGGSGGGGGRGGRRRY